jgi:hypothetical protein
MESIMKTIAALVAGLLLSLTTFVAGLAVALAFLNADEPGHRLDARNTAALWSAEPVAVDRTSQPFERIAARVAVNQIRGADLNIASMGAKATTAAPHSEPSAEVARLDPETTGAIDASEPATDPAADTWRRAAHVDWCARRYRSYNAEDNSYRPYGGKRKACESPYSATTAAEHVTDSADAVAPVAEGQPVARDEARPLEQVAYEDSTDSYADGAHIQSCFERYRSYRPEDNSYQPFDGGPRRQCR